VDARAESDEFFDQQMDLPFKRRLVVYGGATGLVRISCIYPIEQQIGFR